MPQYFNKLPSSKVHGLFSLQQITLLKLIFIPCMASLLPQGHAEEGMNHTKENGHKLLQVISPQLLFQIKIHGCLLWASLGFLMPIGILVIRMSQREEFGRKMKITMFYAHIVLEILVVLLATVGAALSMKNFNNSFINSHQRMGLALYIAVWLQTLTAILRPNRERRGRSGWFFCHWLLGTSISLLGVVNTYTGLQAYHKRTSRSINFWTLIFFTQISLVIFCIYFKKNGTISRKPERLRAAMKKYNLHIKKHFLEMRKAKILP